MSDHIKMQGRRERARFSQERTETETMNQRTEQLLVPNHEILDKPTRKHQIMYLLRRTRNRHLHRRLRIMLALPPTQTLRRLLRHRHRRPRRLPHAGPGSSHRPRRDTPRRTAVDIRQPLDRRTPARHDARAVLAGAREPPDVVDDVERRVAREERGEGVFRLARGELDRVGDEERGHLLFERCDLVDRDGELIEDGGGKRGGLVSIGL